MKPLSSSQDEQQEAQEEEEYYELFRVPVLLCDTTNTLVSVRGYVCACEHY